MQATVRDRTGQQGTDAPRSPRELLLPALGVFVLFLTFSAVRMPIPAPNEPHYLAKAKHYWEPDFCPGDFFLDSADTHRVFYQTVGWLTRFLTLEQTADAGRIAGYLLLAAGWTAFASQLTPHRWGSLWAAGFFLAIAAAGNFSGEWMVGGIEAKIFSYAFLFCGLAALFAARWIAAGLFFGLAIAFHPVVGVWGVAAALFAAAARLLSQRSTRVAGAGPVGSPDRRRGIEQPVETGASQSLQPRPSSSPRALDDAEPRPPVAKTLAIALAALVIAALPGLLPALEVVGAASRDVQFQADYIAVFYRLKHHLDPMDFGPRQYAGYGALLGFWLISRLFCPTAQRASSWFAWFVLGSVVIALAGLAVGWGPRPAIEMPFYETRMKLMKFYPFRLADIMLPVACAISLAGFAAANARRRAGYVWLAFAAATLFALALPSAVLESNPRHMNAGELADWREACAWISLNAPRDAHFHTPPHSWAFKWHARRAEFVSRKDCPQDAAGIVEWNRRLNYRADWSRRHFDAGYSAAALEVFQRETGVTHWLTSRGVNLPLEPIYANGHFSVYRLP